MKNLIIDPEFRDKIPPLSTDEFFKLEENILTDGEVREPLVLWNDTIIDGHHRWKIIQRHPEIPYKVKEMDFPDKWAAIVWMCRNQLGRRNITDEQKTVLIGEAYNAQKMTQGTNNQYIQSKSENRQSGDFRKTGKTEVIIAKKFGVGQGTVARAKQYVDGLNAAEAVSPGIKEAVLSGEVKAPKKVISEIRRMPEEKKVEVVEAIKRGDKVLSEYVPVRNATPVEPRPAYNLDDFREELMAVVKSFDRSFEITLVMAHKEMLDSAEGCAVANEVFAAAHDAIEKYQKLVKEAASGGKNI